MQAIIKNKTERQTGEFESTDLGVQGQAIQHHLAECSHPSHSGVFLICTLLQAVSLIRLKSEWSHRLGYAEPSSFI